jgi:hypothetical protein
MADLRAALGPVAAIYLRAQRLSSSSGGPAIPKSSR